MMQGFKPIEGAYCILFTKGGTYRQAGLYEWRGTVYARYGSGFIRLSPHGHTSSAVVKCDPEWISVDAANIQIKKSGDRWVVKGVM